jgi:hypothetical protein
LQVANGYTLLLVSWLTVLQYSRDGAIATGLNVQNKLAILIALAKRPERRATLDELRDEVAAAETDKPIGSAGQLHSFDHIDVFETGLMVAEGDSLLITDNGCSLLRALGIVPQEQPDLDPLATVQSLNLIDELIGAEAHRKIFDGPSRLNDQDADGLETVLGDSPSIHTVEDPTHETGDNGSASANADESPRDAPPFLTAKFGSGVQAPPQRNDVRSRIAALMKRAGKVWRGHPRQDQRPVVSAIPRSSTKVERVLFALLSLLVLAGAAVATVAFVQVRTTSSELAALQRELLPLKERLARLELIERGKELADKADNPKRPSAVENRFVEPPLVLSREEIQFIRDYIKPAPIPGGSSALPIGIGDPVTGPTLPFPSSVTEKVPKLLGVRFTIRNGAIVVVSRDGRRADAVLGQN